MRLALYLAAGICISLCFFGGLILLTVAHPALGIAAIALFVTAFAVMWADEGRS
jgi:hypothetical protein